MNYDAVPAALKAIPQWVTWVLEGGVRKVPYNPKTGKRASSTNAQTWTDFTTACRAAEARKHAGVGFVFTPDDPYTGIDLDDCVENDTIATWAQDIVTTMDSYSEISPSGTGIKIWVEGKLSQNIKTQTIELYSFGRYFTVTGQHLASTPTSIRSVNGALEQLADSVRPTVEEVEQHQSPSARVTDSAYLRQWADGVIDSALARLRAAPLGTKHNTLLDMSRLLGGLIPLGLADESTLISLLSQNTDAHSDHPHTAHTTIRDGLAMGMTKPLTPPAAPPQPLFDADGFACCPHHKTRLPRAKNGNGYKCHQKDDGTASTWCDFWWSGDGYIAPREQPFNEQSAVVTGDVIQVTAKSPQLFQLYRMDDLRLLPPVSWLIPGELPAGLLSVLCGPSEAGKSFLSVDFAMMVARANPARLVVYVAAEGGSGYLRRCEAWLVENGGEQPANLAFVLRSVPVLDAATLGLFIATINPYYPVLVILDTMARCMVGGDENSAKDVGVFIEGCDEIRRQTGAAVLVIHHTGKSGIYRGSSALYGGSDNWIDFANDDGLITVSCGKAKDWKKFEPRYLRMVERGESVVLLPAEQVSQRGASLTEGQRKVLETLALDVFREAGAKSQQIMNATGIPEKTLFRVLSRLKRDYMVDQGKRGDPYTITDRGLSEIKSYHRALRESRLSHDAGQHEGSLSHTLSPEYPHQDGVLSPTVTPTVTQSDSVTVSTVTSPVTPPYIYIYKGVGDDSAVDSGIGRSATDGGSDLFPETNTPTETMPDSSAKRGPDWVYLNRMYDTANIAGFGTHCVIYGLDMEQALAKLEAERGIKPSDDDELF